MTLELSRTFYKLQRMRLPGERAFYKDNFQIVHFDDYLARGEMKCNKNYFLCH